MKWLRLGETGHEVERWQTFLRGCLKTNLLVTGVFDNYTLEQTKRFQAMVKQTADGIVGNATLGAAALRGFSLVDDHSVDEDGPNWPTPPTDLKFLSMAERVKMFGLFKYVATPTSANPESIKIVDDWVALNIVSVNIPQLKNVKNAPKNNDVKIHKLVKDQFRSMWSSWETEKLLDNVMTFNGTFVPRFIRGSQTNLSNHSWGTAIDINVPWNGLGTQGALKGDTGSVRELVLIAHKHGFVWGGFYKTRKDPMHFEVYKVL